MKTADNFADTLARAGDWLRGFQKLLRKEVPGFDSCTHPRAVAMLKEALGLPYDYDIGRMTLPELEGILLQRRHERGLRAEAVAAKDPVDRAALLQRRFGDSIPYGEIGRFCDRNNLQPASFRKWKQCDSPLGDDSETSKSIVRALQKEIDDYFEKKTAHKSRK